MPSSMIIIPTFNERENIEAIVESVFSVCPEVSILIVDDNSPDGTGKVAESLRGRYEGRLFVLHRPRKMGLGTAYIEGFRFALAQGADYIFEMDADFSHDPHYLPDFLAAIEGSDLVLGSRYVAGGGVRNWGIFRRFLSMGGSWYARSILSLPYRDLTGGFKCFRREVLETIPLDDVRSNGYAFQIELTYKAHLYGFRVREIPIVFTDRRVGQSKMSRRIFLEALFMVWKLRFMRGRLEAAAMLPRRVE
ncbi:MAG: polyprenol monophosphomannose synthase [Deltaproteobacteria bacterium]|nr:MAG: polyprenol monophosphomannose synthase [Deltaproteobacteria bacterium]